MEHPTEQQLLEWYESREQGIKDEIDKRAVSQAGDKHQRKLTAIYHAYRDTHTGMYYLKIPLRYLVPPAGQQGGQKSFDAKVKGILEDIARGIIPSWCTDTTDLEKAVTVERGSGLPDQMIQGNKEGISARRLAHEFLELAHICQVEIAHDLGLLNADDMKREFKHMEMERLIFQRARSQDRVKELADAIASFHNKGK